MGQGANITISNFSSHILQIGVQGNTNTSIREQLDQVVLQPDSGLRPVYIEAQDSNAALALGLTVMRSNGRGGYEPDPVYDVSQARLALQKGRWNDIMQVSAAVLVDSQIQQQWQQDLCTIFLHNQMVAHRLRLYRSSREDPNCIWQGSSDGRVWGALWAPLALASDPPQPSTIPEYDLKIDGTTTQVKLIIGNESYETISLDVQGGDQGSWLNQTVPDKGTWERTLSVENMRVGDRWELRIQSLPDPKFYITRRGD
jgi:hypothetical protein